jgi:hypothetical protein
MVLRDCGHAFGAARETHDADLRGIVALSRGAGLAERCRMSRSDEIALRRAAKQFWSRMEQGSTSRSSESALQRMAQRFSRLPQLVRSVGLLAAGATVAFLAVRGLDGSPSVAPVVASEPSRPPQPSPAPPSSCPPPAPAPAPPPPPHPELSSPDGYSVIDHGFPAFSAKAGKVAVVTRGTDGEVAIKIFASDMDYDAERVPIIERGELEHARDQPRGPSLASRVATRLTAANQQLAGFVTMSGTELGLTADEVLATKSRATTVQVGELAIHHQGRHVSVRRAANPRDITLEWITAELDSAGACAPYLAAAYTLNNVLVLRFDHARCTRPAEHRAFILGAESREPLPWSPTAPRVDLETGVIEGLPAVSPDGATIAVEPLEPGPESHCEIPLLRSSDGSHIEMVPTVPDGEECNVQVGSPSPARLARNRELAARFAGWRSLPVIDAEKLGNRVSIRRGRRLWQIDFPLPAPDPDAADGRDRCSNPPLVHGARVWHLSDHSVLLNLSLGGGPHYCYSEDWQVKPLPELGKPERVTP